MKQYFWILLIKILALEFDVFKANAVSSEDFLQPPSDVRLISIDTSTLQLLWRSPNTTNETLTGYNITWDGNGTFVGNSSTAFDITNLPTPGRNYTASISAYYATQQNSAYINVSKNTFPSSPYNLIVTSTGTNWLNISFDKVGQWDWCYAWADNATGSSGSCSPASETATITNLPMAGNEYTIHIVAQSGSLNSSSATTMQRTIPSPPYNLIVTGTNRGTNSLNISFDKVGQWNSCYAWADNAAGSSGSCYPASETAAITSLPVAGNEYTIHIVAQSGSFNSSIATTIQRTNPSNASSITVVSRQMNRFDLNWTNQGLSDNCFVWVEEEASATTACFTGNKTAVIANLLTAGKQYTIHIVIRSSQLNSTTSTFTERTNPSPASSITVVSRQMNRFDLNWTNQGLSDNCFVWVEEAPNATTTCFTGNKTAVIAKLPTPGKQYTIHTVVRSDQLNSMTSTFTERTSPPNPGSLYCSTRTNTSLTIGIGPPSGSSYELDGYLFSILSKIPMFNYSVSRTENASTTQPNVTLVATNMTAGVTYSITAKTTIKSLISSGQSYSECTTDLNAPGNVRINNTSEMTVQIIWDAQGNFDGFNASCYGQNQAKYVSSILYRSPGPGSINTFNTVCDGMTAGAQYSVSVSTFLNQTTLTSMKPSNPVWTVTVPQPPKNVTAYPIDTNSIQMQLLYGYTVDVSQCTFYKILYSNRTDFIACGPTSVNYNLLSLESDSMYSINTSALSNYSASTPSISRNSSQTAAWTLAPPVNNITGNESLPWSLEVIIGHQPFPKNVWQYVIRVINSTHSVQRVQITCSDANKMTMTTVNCAWNYALSVLNSTATCSAGFSYNITELRPYMNYTISAQAVNPGGCSGAKSIVLSTNESTPLCLNIANARANITMIDLVWSAPREPNGLITGYEVTYFPEGHDPNVTIANVTHTNETSITLVGLDAYVNYTIKVAAINGAGVGTFEGCENSTVTEQTLIRSPYEPQLTATSLSPDSALINWTLSVDKKTGPETYYNLTLNDPRDSTFIIYAHIAGFYNRSWEVSDLDAYWNYSVAIVAYIIDEYGEELATEGAEIVTFRTLESTPGQLQSFDVSSLSDVQQCNASRVTWKAPVERDLNGIITGYVIRWQQVSGAGSDSTEVPFYQHETTVRVQPDNKEYSFTIRAKTLAGEGVARTQTLPSTGRCLPTPVQNVSSVLMKPSTDDDLSTTNSFPVTYDLNFFQENDNGDITHSGLFVREVSDNENVTGMTDTGGQSLYTNALTWSEAIKQKKIPEYRATGDNWLSESATRKKRSSSSNYTIFIGGNMTCSKDSNAACNGPLPSNREYKVGAILCTENGCYRTEYTPYTYKTKKPASNAWIAAVVIVPIVCIVAAVLVVLYIRRTNRENRKRKTNESEIQVFGQGSNHQRFRITSKPIALELFKDIVASMHRDSDLHFSDEYREIQESSPKYPWTEAEGESVKAKNRFINILPFDRTRVHLEEFRSGSDYINANYILSGLDRREYIAAQGPLHTTLDDFWNMVWQEKSTVIVMLTNLKENGRVKCEQYWPKTLNETIQFGQVSVTMTNEQDYTSYVIRHFTAKVKSESRYLTQFHFVAWPDFGVPAQPQLLVDCIRAVRESIGQQIGPPTVVHCSAGVGRTGTFIALDRLLRQVNNATSIDVFGTVLQLREFRCQMVQTETQYIFIHDCMSLEIERLLNPESTYEGVYNDAFEVNSEPLYANENQIKQALNNGTHSA